MSSSSFVGERGRGTTETLAVIPFGGKSEDEEWLERADHPLMNDLILKLLFEHVSLRRSDLKACRVVCKKWNEHVIPLMRSIFQVTTHEDQNAETCQMDDFLKLFKTNVLGIPFAKYQVGPFRTTEGAGKEFIEICGQSIKEIVLVQQPYPGQYVQTIEDISELLKFLPKLEALTLSGPFVSLHRNVVKQVPDLSTLRKLTFKHDSHGFLITSCPCPTIFDELLNLACNISHIAIDGMGSKRNGIPKVCITHVLSSIERLGRESSIQTLSLKSVSFEDVEILKRMAEKPNGLKLKGISFSSDSNSEGRRNASVQIQLATIFKDTMEDFKVIGGSRYRTIYLIDFPVMPKLKSLKFGDMEDDFPRPVDLNQIFPVLETLNVSSGNVHYDSDDGNGYLEFFSQFQVCPTVKTFTMDYNFVCVRTFNNILGVFQNLRKLTLSVREETRQVLQLIWTRMTQLESLSLSAHTEPKNVMELDSLVTGIPIEALNEIREVIPDLEKMTGQERREEILNLVETHKTQEPSIRNLTDLKDLKLELNGGWESISCLSDLTGYLGIYLMKRLIHLDIGHCNFTKTCCEILTRETGVEAWRFHTDTDIGTNEHITPPFGISDRNHIWN